MEELEKSSGLFRSGSAGRGATVIFVRVAETRKVFGEVRLACHFPAIPILRETNILR